MPNVFNHSYNLLSWNNYGPLKLICGRDASTIFYHILVGKSCQALNKKSYCVIDTFKTYTKCMYKERKKKLYQLIVLFYK